MFDPSAMPFTRRQFLAENAMGIGAVALAWLNSQQTAGSRSEQTAQGTVAL